MATVTGEDNGAEVADGINETVAEGEAEGLG
jgi:hypothetical protein